MVAIFCLISLTMWMTIQQMIIKWPFWRGDFSCIFRYHCAYRVCGARTVLCLEVHIGQRYVTRICTGALQRPSGDSNPPTTRRMFMEYIV
jgi:hypothetical protein